VTRTTFEDGDAAWEVVDFAPRMPRGLGVEAPVELVRLVRPLRGTPRLTIDFAPRGDYARAPTRLAPSARGVELLDAGGPMHLFSNLPRDYILSGNPVAIREPTYFVLHHGHRLDAPSLPEVMHMLDETVLGWRAWAKTCALPTFAPAQVLRSALCLKLHVYEDTGAIVAAATTSIPEAMGTPRTWDYRYCWLRDAAFVVEALRRLSHLAEGERFLDFLRHVAENGPLRPLYTVGGELPVEEQILDHLAGFGGNGWVRVGNAAVEQKQNDLHGELMLSLASLLTDPRLAIDDLGAYMPLVEQLVDQAIRNAPEPDTGIWEFRSMLRNYTFSRAMCWAAIDRGSTFAHRVGRTDLASAWRAEADRERDIVLARGYSPILRAFTQALDGEHPDAANLLLPSIGIIDPRDPRFRSTLQVYEQRLARSGLLLRYVNPDDFGQTTSAFTMCSFWWAEALALAGRLDDAVVVFDRVAAYANPVGLFSEDIDPATGTLLGNFPQAYTHVGLIHAAMTISELLEARDGRVRAWI
jgi:GH15 family glucan-1,4-alpha-glucosidase